MSGAALIVNRAALAENLARLRQQTTAAIMAVIKANAYGHGMLLAAQALDDADAFAVARVEEAQALRAAGIAKPITVFGGIQSGEELRLCGHLHLQPVIHASHQVELLGNYTGTPLDVWLKVDTGMHRLGFAADQSYSILHKLRSLNSVNSVSLMSHMAEADTRHAEKNNKQMALFQQLHADMSVPASLANSASALNWPDSHYDWIRPGIALYGASPLVDTTASELGLIAAMHFYSHVVAEHALSAGQTLGYGGTWRARRDSRIGVISVGYGDGYPRHALNNTPVLINGERVPLVGTVSMDMITVDLTDARDAKVGSKATLWGPGLPAEEVALHANTISYQLFSNVTDRVQRNAI